MAKVYIGVGHGGSDPGAVKYLVEKDVNLKMALACRDYLLANGVDVKISRENDKSVSINTKCAEANAWGADLALDIHNNAGGGDGAEVFHSICYGTGAELAKNILAELEKIGQNSRGTKVKKNAAGKDYFGFIRNTKMPAVITEALFVDNAADAAQADTDEECKAFGVAIAKGLLKTLGVTTAPSKPAQSASPYKVKVTVNALNIRSGAGTNYKINGVIRDRGVYTIVDVCGNWGKLKSCAGWICLDFTKRV